MINKPTTIMPNGSDLYKANMRNTHNGAMSNSVGPLMMKGVDNKSVQSQSIILDGMNKNKQNKYQSFKDVWKKAIEKYSPRKPTKLNEVSFRFQ